MNPIIPGFAPDPSIILVDDTYYLVNSTFHIFPGLPVYASKDLVSWRHITNAFNRPEQLSLKYSSTEHSPDSEWGEVMSAAGGLYAPTIRHHSGTFYIICTNITRTGNNVENGMHQNFIITTTDIYSHNWSDPIFFDFNGIDTSLVWDDDGKAYLHGSAAPGPMTLIKIFEIDVKTGAKLTDEKLLWKGTGGIWPEGPHIYRKDDYWYLMISEGGTFEDHMITVARSKELFGPYEANPLNPILTARGTDDYIQHTGHCDMFSDKQGQWWCVCLAVRKDPKKRYIMGRETFLTPGAWPKGEWPTLKPVKMDFQATYGMDMGKPKTTLSSEPLVDFCYIRDVDLSAYKISNQGATIELTSSKADLSDPQAPISFVGKRQRVLDGHASVILQPSRHPEPTTTTAGKAGLAVYKDEFRYARIYQSLQHPREIVHEVVNKARKINRVIRKACPSATTGNDIKLKLEYTEDSYTFSFSAGPGDDATTTTKFDTFDNVDLVGPDFTGPIIGVFSTSWDGDDRSGRVVFRELEVE